jgi:hypothetical protein
MVLEKDSSVLGYPGETSKALDADHHGVCKYESPKDPNYITVRNVLKSLMSKIVARSNMDLTRTTRKETIDIKSLLAISELPNADYIFFRDQWEPGTNEWILHDPYYREWVDVGDSSPRFLWLRGGPAAGKSVCSSFIINSLIEAGFHCQYFFIRYGDRRKRSSCFLLRSLAYQVAQNRPDFLQGVAALANEATSFEGADARTIWERIFKPILFQLVDARPLYWVIDGLDEAEDPRAMVKLLSEITSANIPIRIMVISRETSEIDAAFRRVAKALDLRTVDIAGHTEDLRHYIRQELSIPGDTSFRSSIEQRLLDGAQDNFLVSLRYTMVWLPH